MKTHLKLRMYTFAFSFTGFSIYILIYFFSNSTIPLDFGAIPYVLTIAIFHAIAFDIAVTKSRAMLFIQSSLIASVFIFTFIVQGSKIALIVGIFLCGYYWALHNYLRGQFLGDDLRTKE